LQVFILTFLYRKKSYKRTLSPTAVSDEFSPLSLKLLIFALQKSYAELFNVHSAEFVPEPSVKAEMFLIYYVKAEYILNYFKFDMGLDFASI